MSAAESGVVNTLDEVIGVMLLDQVANAYEIECLESVKASIAALLAERGWREMDSAPRDGTLLQLRMRIVDREEWAPTEDNEEYTTIGGNSFDHTGIDEWDYAGWCWNHDHFCMGVGSIPIAWAPLLPAPPAIAQGGDA